MSVYNEPDRKKWTKDKRHWFFRCTYEDTNGNKKRYKSKMFFTQDDAKEAEIDFIRKSKMGNFDENIMIFDDLYFEWLETKKKTIKTATYYQLKVNSQKNILTPLHNIKLKRFNKVVVYNWLNELENKNLSIRYKNKIIKRLKNILLYGKHNYNINPQTISLLQPIKNEAPIKNKTLSNYWTLQEFKQFINVVNNKLYYVLFNFLYYTGCRIGETTALNWHDVDFNKKQVSINKTLTTKTGTGKHLITSPKTHNSIRTIDLPNNLLNILKEHYNSEKATIDFNENWFIFGGMKYLPSTTISRHLNFYIKKANVKKITLHGFRHSHVSLLVYLGCDFRDVAERLGDTIEMVQNTYYHMFPEEKSKTVKLLNTLK